MRELRRIRFVAFKTGYITSEPDNQGVAGTAATTPFVANVPAMTRKVTITLADDLGTPNRTLTFTSAPTAFAGTAGEIAVFDGGVDVTGSLAFAAGAWTYTFAPPAKGSSLSIVVQADPVSDSATTGYYATKKYTVVAGQSAPATSGSFANAATDGAKPLNKVGNTGLNLPAGGLKQFVANLSFLVSEADPAVAGGDKVTASKIVQIEVIDDDTGEDASDQVSKIYVTLSFDPAVVTKGSIESGDYVIFHADDIAAMVAGDATTVPLSQIQNVDYDKGEVTFWLTSLSAVGVGAAPAVPPAVGGGDSGTCFIGAAGNSLPGAGWLMVLGAGLIAGLCAVRFRK